MRGIPLTRLRALGRAATIAVLAVSASLGAIATPASGGIITGHAVINEVVANPLTGSAWVEIYDPTSGASICGIVDAAGNETSGCGTMTGDFVTYVIDPDFLDDDGDTITLRGTSGDLDTVTYPPLGPGESYARTFDGSTEWEIRSGTDVTRNASNGPVPDDSTPPILTVANPVSGGTYAGGFTATYTASDPGAGVLRVAFYVRDGASSGPYDWHDTDINTAAQEPFTSIEDFSALPPGTYDLCVTAIDRLGNGAPATTAPVASCDDESTAVVAIDDVVVTDHVTPPDEPTVTLTAPADGTVTNEATPTLTWATSIDPGFTVARTEVVLSTSADFSATPVTFAPTGDSLALPESFAAAADATWYWKVVLTFFRTPTSPDETVESPAWTFTVDRGGDGIPTRPRFEVNGEDLASYAYTGPGDTTVHPLDTCVLTFETFDIGAGTAEIDIVSGDTLSSDPSAATPLVEGEVITSNHAPTGSNGTWRFDLADHADRAIAGPDGYLLSVAIFTDDRHVMEVITRFSLPLTCLTSDDPSVTDPEDPTTDPEDPTTDPDDPSSSDPDAETGAPDESDHETLPTTGSAELVGLVAGMLLTIIGAVMIVRHRARAHG